MIKKKLLFIIIVIIAVCFIFLFKNSLGDFKILSFNQDINNTTNFNYLTWTKSNNAKKYQIKVLNISDNEIAQFETSDNKVNLDNINVKYNEEIKFEIIAINGKKTKISKSNMTYIWSIPTINLKNNTIETIDSINQDINIKLDNNNFNNLYISIDKNNNTLYNETINDNLNITNIINKTNDIYGNYNISLYTNINNKTIILNRKTLSINIPSIRDLIMDSPIDNTEIAYDDFTLDFSGGNNADTFLIKITDQDNNIIIENQKLKWKSIDIKKDQLKPNTKYYITVTAYNEYQKDVIKNFNYTFITANNNKVSSIISTKQEGEIGQNRPIRLSTNTVDSKIHYTTDGSNPSCKSTTYIGNIYIKKTMTIKAIACKENMDNSDILSLTYKPIKKQKAIYLSPSNQDDNFGAKGTGYTTEAEIMNKVADIVEEKLKKNNVIVYRNNSDMDLNQIIIASSAYDVDMHLAIHSNAYDTYQRGPEVWVHNDEWEEANKIANLIHKKIMEIYPTEKYDRGVRYSTWIGGLRETNPMNTTSGVLVEVAFHDNYTDATWVMKNIENIGNKITDAVIEYLNE